MVERKIYATGTDPSQLLAPANVASMAREPCQGKQEEHLTHLGKARCSQAYLFSMMDRGMEFVFCRMGTNRSTIAAAKSPKSSGFNLTVNSPAAIIRCVKDCQDWAKHTVHHHRACLSAGVEQHGMLSHSCRRCSVQFLYSPASACLAGLSLTRKKARA